MSFSWTFYRICPHCDMPVGRAGSSAWLTRLGRHYSCPPTPWGPPHSDDEIAAWRARALDSMNATPSGAS